MSDTAAWVNQFTVDEQKLAFTCIYDSCLATSNMENQLCAAAILDSKVQTYLHLLAECGWDPVWAQLKSV
jgi:hypothetical protein